jgi:hypothetical protein
VFTAANGDVGNACGIALLTLRRRAASDLRTASAAAKSVAQRAREVGSDRTVIRRRRGMGDDHAVDQLVAPGWPELVLLGLEEFHGRPDSP